MATNHGRLSAIELSSISVPLRVTEDVSQVNLERFAAEDSRDMAMASRSGACDLVPGKHDECYGAGRCGDRTVGHERHQRWKQHNAAGFCASRSSAAIEFRAHFCMVPRRAGHEWVGCQRELRRDAEKQFG